MHMRLFAAASFAGLASLVAGGAQATAVLVDFGGPVAGWGDATSSQTNVGMEVGPGALPVALTATFSFAEPAPQPTDIPQMLSKVALIEAAADPRTALQAAGVKPEGVSTAQALAGGREIKISDPLDLGAAKTATSFGEDTVAGGKAGGFLGAVVAPIAIILVPPDLVTTVPEPASWALMLVGFGSLGGMLRRRRQLA